MQNYKEKQDIWPVKKMLSWMESYFESKNIESPRLGAELLLCKVLDTDRVGIYTNFDKPLSTEELSHLKSLIKRRVAFEPVAYITGEKAFFDLDLNVNKGVLIPRPDTERLIEVVEDLYKKNNAQDLVVADLGTGSGAIALSIAQLFENSMVYGIDISIEALKTAFGNARKYNLEKKVRFINSRWLTGISMDMKFDLIVSNPPYIRTEDIETLQPEIRLYEPVNALDGGSDGLDCYRDIISQAPFYLKKDGYLIFEAGFDQRKGLEALCAESQFFEFIDMIKDYGGRDRVAVIKKIS